MQQIKCLSLNKFVAEIRGLDLFWTICVFFSFVCCWFHFIVGCSISFSVYFMIFSTCCFWRYSKLALRLNDYCSFCFSCRHCCRCRSCRCSEKMYLKCTRRSFYNTSGCCTIFECIDENGLSCIWFWCRLLQFND